MAHRLGLALVYVLVSVCTAHKYSSNADVYRAYDALRAYSLSSPVVRATSLLGGVTESVQVNNMDGPMKFEVRHVSEISTMQKLWCGAKSHHSNYYEDREFTMRLCSLSESAELQFGVGKGMQLLQSQWDRDFKMECPDSMLVYALQSTHSNYYEDRLYKMFCVEAANLGPDLSSCVWHSSNGYDGGMDFTCPGGRAVFGLSTTHSNYYEDRRYKFKCCTVVSK